MSDQNASSFATIEDLEARYKPLGLGQKKPGSSYRMPLP